MRRRWLPWLEHTVDVLTVNLLAKWWPEMLKVALSQLDNGQTLSVERVRPSGLALVCFTALRGTLESSAKCRKG